MQLAQRRLFTETDETEGELNLQSSECRTEVQRERNGLLAYDIVEDLQGMGAEPSTQVENEADFTVYRVCQKSGPTDSSPYFCQILTDLNNFFYWKTLWYKFAVKWILKNPAAPCVCCYTTW